MINRLAMMIKNSRNAVAGVAGFTLGLIIIVAYYLSHPFVVVNIDAINRDIAIYDEKIALVSSQPYLMGVEEYASILFLSSRHLLDVFYAPKEMVKQNKIEVPDGVGRVIFAVSRTPLSCLVWVNSLSSINLPLTVLSVSTNISDCRVVLYVHGTTNHKVEK